MLTYSEAVARVTAPGERFETVPVEIGGVTYRVDSVEKDGTGLTRWRLAELA